MFFGIDVSFSLATFIISDSLSFSGSGKVSLTISGAAVIISGAGNASSRGSNSVKT